MAVLSEVDERDGVERRGRVAVRTSPVLEVVWFSYLHDDESGYPAREAVLTESPELAERMLSVWGDEACFTELAVLANQAGVLFEDDIDAVWEAVERVAADPPRHEDLDSENPTEKLLIRTRIGRLHEDGELRARWLDTMRSVWAALAEGWENEGRQYAEALQCDLRSKLGDRAVYADLEPYVKKTWHELLQRLVRSAVDEDLEITVVPAWMGRMNLILSFFDRLIMSPVVSEPPASPTVATRGRARRFKALGDPTRLAIFEAVARRPRTVGELARLLRLAQPTVSNHVRLLRDAGLLEQDGEGRRLSPDLGAFDRLLDEARRAVTPTC